MMRSFIAAVMIMVMIGISGTSIWAGNLEGWGETRWGMSKDEILTLMGDKVQNIKNNADIDERIHLSNILVGGFSFQVELIVTKDKLTAVRFIVPGYPDPIGSYNRIKSLLAQKYGQPDNEMKVAASSFSMEPVAEWFKGITTIYLTTAPFVRDMTVSTNVLIIYKPAQKTEGL